jgi:sugar phosphate isomerase/epimerase
MEANPSIYHTNYMNYTSDALELVRKVGSKGFKLNLDTGAMIENGEDAAELEGCVHLINHVHISEPRLKPIAERDLHRKLKEILMKEEYSGFVSIEMNKTDNISAMEETLQYVRGVFGNPLSRKTV